MTEVRDIKLSTDKVLAYATTQVGHVILNNPEKHNAVSLDMWDAIDMAFSVLSSDDSVRVVVLSGAGGKSFVSGADISKYDRERGSKEEVNHYNARVKTIYNLI